MRILDELSANVILDALDMEGLAALPPFDPAPRLRLHFREPVVDLDHIVVIHIHILGECGRFDDGFLDVGWLCLGADLAGSRRVWSLVRVALR